MVPHPTLKKSLPWFLITIGIAVLITAIVMGRPNHVALACDATLSKAMLDEGLRLGTDFILANQLPVGNFRYEYDWLTKTVTDDDSPVRQAGALWGLALIYGHTHEARLIDPLEKGLSFFERASKVRADGARYIIYPGETSGDLGTVALVALAHIDYLSAHGNEMTAAARDHQKMVLDGYLRFLQSGVRKDGLFASSYDSAGKPYGDPSSYYDGEALLALVKAARYQGYDPETLRVKELADAGYTHNVKEALKADPDSDITKGYYQWSSMAYRELAESSWRGTGGYADHAIDLADWMIDTHNVLDRTKNTGYAFEGIISAYLLAEAKNDTAHMQKFKCAIETGLSSLLTWQVGASYENQFIRSQFDGDTRARGGIQNAADEAPLRIDVTQHQMHAVILALEALYKEK